MGNAGNKIREGVEHFGKEVGKVFNSPQEEAPQQPGEDPRLAQIRREQQKQSDEFSKNAPGLKDKIYGNIERSERENLAGKLADTKAGYNRRGLLFSGMRQGAEQSQRARSASTLAKERSNVNQMVDAQAEALKMAPINSGIAAQKSAQAIQDEIYGEALSNFQARNQVLGAGFGAIGAGVGSYLGRKS